MSIPDAPDPGPQTLVPNDVPPSSAPVPDRGGFRLPVTTYIWFVLLCVGALWSRFPDAPRVGAALSRSAADSGGANAKKGGGARLDSSAAQAFGDYVDAERLTRGALAGPYLSASLMGVAREGGRATGAPKPSRPDDPARSSRKLYDDAIRQTRALAARTGSMNLARRVLVLERLAGRPLDEKYLTGTLTENLKGREVKADKIKTELGFWRGLYGNAQTAQANRPTFVKNAKAIPDDFEIGLLQDKVRADIARALGDPQTANRLDAQVGQTALRSSLVTLGLVVLMGLAALGGVGLLITLAVIAGNRRLGTLYVSDVPLLPSSAWGTLLDCFVFYFALMFLGRPVLGLAAREFLPRDPQSVTPALAIGVTTLSSFLVQGIAVAYTVVALRRSGLSPNLIGWNGRRLAANIGWGILGYCAVIPVVFLLGIVATALFRDNPNIAPNPALPLLTSAEGWGPRLLIFALVAIGAPLFEEFFFRGVLYTGLRARWGVAASIAVSALLFAIGHPVQDWLPILGLGAAFAALREWRQSLVPGMVAHFLQNGLTFLMLSSLFSR